MRCYKNGVELEEAVFGCSMDGRQESFREGRADFSEDVNALIRESKSKCPDTLIGNSIYQMLKRGLERFGIETRGLKLISAVNTKSDLRHHFDGLFFLSAISSHPVTLDLWNIDPLVFSFLKERWTDSFPDQFYLDEHRQSDLFRYKVGMVRWMRDNYCRFLRPEVLRCTDFRRFAMDIGRPENHFIITPYHVGSRRQRRVFAGMVVKYFAKVSGHKMAELSH